MAVPFLCFYQSTKDLSRPLTKPSFRCHEYSLGFFLPFKTFSLNRARVRMHVYLLRPGRGGDNERYFFFSEPRSKGKGCLIQLFSYFTPSYHALPALRRKRQKLYCTCREVHARLDYGSMDRLVRSATNK